MILQGAGSVAPFKAAFDNYWSQKPSDFDGTASAEWSDLGLSGIDARVAFSPHSTSNAKLAALADDIGQNTTSSLLYSLAFLYQTKGPVRDAIKKVTESSEPSILLRQFSPHLRSNRS